MRSNEQGSRRFAILAVCVAALLAGCAIQAETDPQNRYACQTLPCVCEPEELTLFNRGDTVPLLWKENGDAYCPEGHVLKRVNPDE